MEQERREALQKQWQPILAEIYTKLPSTPQLLPPSRPLSGEGIGLWLSEAKQLLQWQAQRKEIWRSCLALALLFLIGADQLQASQTWFISMQQVDG